MPLCPDCGHIHPAELAAPAAEAEAAEAAAHAETRAAESLSSAEVEIARIQADRDIKLAKIGRGIAHEALEAEVTEDAVKADILDQAMEPAEPEPAIVVEAEAEAEADPEPEAEIPPVVDAGPEPVSQGNRNPWW